MKKSSSILVSINIFVIFVQNLAHLQPKSHFAIPTAQILNFSDSFNKISDEKHISAFHN
jgi:hypothetical protein